MNKNHQNFAKFEKNREEREILEIIQNADALELEEYINQKDYDYSTLSNMLLFAIKNSTLRSACNEVVYVICRKITS
jgi:hypothetical protein